MVAADFSDYLKFILKDPRYSGTNSFYTATDALLTLEAEIVKKEELPTEVAERTPEQIERLPVLEMLRKYGLGEKREHLLLAGKPGSGKSTTLRRLCVELAEIALGDELQPIPVFVQLKGDKPLLTIIQAEFRRAKLKVTEEQIDDLLLADKLVLLLDGVNEIPSEQLRRELQDFRENNLTTPTIFTTRDLTVGGSLGIDKRLEMRPLTDEQMQEFVRKYLPEYGDKLLGQLRDRLREIAETPLLLKILCEVFDPKIGQIPQNKGELFELFDRKYQRHNEGVAVSDDFRRFQSEVLQYLGFTMLQGDTQKPTEAWLTLPRQRAESLIENWLKQRGEANPASKAKEWLEDLVEHHLLQVATDPQQIEFHHQLFQEYYAARHLNSMLQGRHPDVVDDERLKHFYLNYLKWTEPLGLLLGLLDDEAQALRVVGLGLEVDWFLGARLAGEVKQGLQSQTVKLVSRLIKEKNLPQWLRFDLWEKTPSSVIVPKLLTILQDSDSWATQLKAAKMIVKLRENVNVYDLLSLMRNSDHWVRSITVEAIGKMGGKSMIPNLLPLLRDSDSHIQSSVVRVVGQLGDKSNIPDLLPLLRDSDSYIQLSVVRVVRQLGDKSNIPDLLPLLKDSDSHVRSSVVEAIGQLGDMSSISNLLPLLRDSDSHVRSSVVEVTGQLGDKSNIPDLLPLLRDSDSHVRSSVVEVTGQLGDKSNIPDLLPLLEDLDPYVRLSVVEANKKLENRDNINSSFCDIWIYLQPYDPDRRRLKKVIWRLENKNLSCSGSSSNEMDVGTWKTLWARIAYATHDPNPLYSSLYSEKPTSFVSSRLLAATMKMGNKSNDITDLLPILNHPECDLHLSAVRMIGQIGGEKAVIILTDVLNLRGANMREMAAKALGEIKEWQDVSPLTRSLAVIALLNSLETHHESVKIAAAGGLRKIGNFKILPRLNQKLTELKDDTVAKIIFAIQAKCEFYNYDIFRIPPTNQKSSPQSLTFNIDKLGNLNTGPVNIQGNQIGIQQPTDPQ